MPKYHSAAAVEIGSRIRDARHKLGITLEDLGDLAETSWTSVGRIERGVQSPTVETLVRLATALGIDPASLISGLTSDDFGDRSHRFTARDFLRERNTRSQPGTPDDVGRAGGARG